MGNACVASRRKVGEDEDLSLALSSDSIHCGEHRICDLVSIVTNHQEDMLYVIQVALKYTNSRNAKLDVDREIKRICSTSRRLQAPAVDHEESLYEIVPISIILGKIRTLKVDEKGGLE